MQVWVLYLIYVAGAVLSIFVPYLVAYLNSHASFDWRKIIGRVIATLVTLLPILGDNNFAKSLAEMNESTPLLTLVFATLSLGWGVSSIGRTVQKAFDTLR